GEGVRRYGAQIRVRRPPPQEARFPPPVGDSYQRGRKTARADLRAADPRSEARRRGARSQEPLGAGHFKSRRIRQAGPASERRGAGGPVVALSRVPPATARTHEGLVVFVSSGLHDRASRYTVTDMSLPDQAAVDEQVAAFEAQLAGAKSAREAQSV